MKKHSGSKPSSYEEKALQQIWKWKNPEQSYFDKAMGIVSWPIGKAANVVLTSPMIGPALQQSFSGVLGVINDVSQWSVRPEAVIQEYRRYTGNPNLGFRELQELDLEVIDRVIGWLDTKYEGLSLAEGAVAGAAGTISPVAALAVIPADVVALMTLSLRAVGEYATYCGFDVSMPEERLFAQHVLALASSSSDLSKQTALAQLVRIARDVSLRKTWKQLEKHMVVQASQHIAKALSIRLTKAKLAQVLPVAGAVVGGGFNAYFVDKVCRAAFYLYRERLLAEKYGVDVIEVTVAPATDLEPNYEEQP